MNLKICLRDAGIEIISDQKSVEQIRSLTVSIDGILKSIDAFAETLWRGVSEEVKKPIKTSVDNKAN